MGRSHLTDDFYFDECGALLDEVEAAGGGVGEIEDASVGERAVVGHGYMDDFAVAQVGDAKAGAAGKATVGGGEFIGRVEAAAGGFVAFKRWAIEGGVTALRFGLIG